MTTLNTTAAEMLETSAAGYAAAALALLRPHESVAPPGNDAGTWKAHFLQRILELAAAVRVAEPGLFARRIAWLRRAAVARGADETLLRRSLLSLQAALQHEVPESLRATIDPALALAMEQFDAEVGSTAITLDARKPHERLALRYLAACLEGAPGDAIALVLDELGRGLAPVDAYVNVLLPAEKEIGELWHVGDVSIAEERIVSETTRALMALIVAKYAPNAPTGRSLIAASVATNMHDIGLRAVSDLFRLAGWRSLFLGASIPAAEIARAAEIFDVDLVVLNATLTTQLSSLARAIEAVRTVAPECKILVGGSALDGVPDLPKRLGADGYASTVTSAVGLGEALVRRLQ